MQLKDKGYITRIRKKQGSLNKRGKLIEERLGRNEIL